ncbi:MAG TPA: YihY/virulence factor BrkB family protein [Gemmatimonadaceae bacterium]|nr:YihY/virulence factor BrkB family protein [Gemmatimonadaceae bacterium]
MPHRPLAIQLGWTLRDYAKRVWDNSGEDNIFFLAGGIAFNILLAIVPFVLLLVSGTAYLLNQSEESSIAEVYAVVDRLLPPNPTTGESPVHQLLGDIISARGPVGLYSAIGFVWFSTRLFGSLRTVLADVFDIEQDRGIVAGKLFDIKVTVFSTLLIAAYTALSAYLAVATTRGVSVLARAGLRDEVMGQIEYTFGRLIAFAFITLMFWALYKFLPNRRVRPQTALVAALFTSLLFELAKNLFTSYVRSFNPGSLYTGTLAAIVIIVSWVYYAALIFILGGEVAQVYELRRVRRMQREAFEE